MVHNPTFAITAITQANPGVVSAAGHTYSNNDQILITNVPGMDEVNKQVFTISNVSAGVSFEINSNTTFNIAATPGGRAALFVGDRIMGIHRYIDQSNVKQTLIFDTTRAAIYDANNDRFNPLDDFLAGTPPAADSAVDQDIMSSDDEEYIWAQGWQHSSASNRMYFTNGKEFDGATLDGIRFFDSQTVVGLSLPTTTTSFIPGLGGTGRNLYGSKLIFSLKQRLVVLNTFELRGGVVTNFPQRARWCAAQNPGNWIDIVAGGGGFVDAPTGDQIVSARALQDSIIVQFTDSVWTLRPVSDPALPFRWDKINDFRACDAKMATTSYDRYVVALGQRGITATDGVETRRIDERIEDFTTQTINADRFDRVFAARNFNKRRTWMLYPEVDSDEANAALIFDEESSGYSTYKFSNDTDYNVLGFGSLDRDFAAEDFTKANDLDKNATGFKNDETALSFFWSGNAELFIAVDRGGVVFELEETNNDNDELVVFSVKSAGWNPFQQEGVEAQFGYIDLYCDTDQRTDIVIKFFKDDNEDEYIERGMNLLPNLNFVADVTSILPNADPTTGFTVTSIKHGITAGESIYIYGVEEADFYNDEKWQVDSVTNNAFAVAKDITGSGVAITGISQGNPGVVTSAGHGFANGATITIVAVTGMTEVNTGIFVVSNATPNTYELTNVDTTGYTAYTGPSGFNFLSYTGGGQIVERRFFRTKVWKRAYAGGIGYLHRIQITSGGLNKPLRISAFKPYFRKRGKRTIG